MGNLLGGATGFLKSLKAGLLEAQNGPPSIFSRRGDAGSWATQNSPRIPQILRLQALQASMQQRVRVSATALPYAATSATHRKPEPQGIYSRRSRMVRHDGQTRAERQQAWTANLS
jgi:hypothetical protein